MSCEIFSGYLQTVKYTACKALRFKRTNYCLYFKIFHGYFNYIVITYDKTNIIVIIVIKQK